MRGRKRTGPNLVPVESPHNPIHLAVGGFDYPGQGDDSAIPGANGDMGENDTAGLDPIFFFHHCFIDYVFWIWQQRHAATHAFDIDPSDPGANSNANPPPAGIDPNTPLTLDTPLEPFRKGDGSAKFTTRDCINIESQLGYTYGPGSLDQYAQGTTKGLIMATAGTAAVRGRTLRASGINRAGIRGSFLISAFATVGGKREYIGTEAVLSRWHVEGCMNCQNHLEATAFFELPPETESTLAAAPETESTLATGDGLEVEVRTHQNVFRSRPHRSGSGAAIAAPETETTPFKVEIE